MRSPTAAMEEALSAQKMGQDGLSLPPQVEAKRSDHCVTSEPARAPSVVSVRTSHRVCWAYGGSWIFAFDVIILLFRTERTRELLGRDDREREQMLEVVQDLAVVVHAMTQ